MTGGDSVLLVEDDENLRGAFRLILEAHGHQVRGSGSVAGAVESLRRSPPAVVVLDLGLPDAGGAGALARVREVAPAVPVLVLTGRDDPDLRARCRALEAAAYRVKPLEGEALADLVGRIVAGAAGDP